MAAGDGVDAPAFALRDGRSVTVGPLQAHERAEVERLVGVADAARAEFYAQVAAEREDAAAQAAGLVAHDLKTGQLIGFIAYSTSGGLAGVVDPQFAGVGLGTLLLHQAAEQARAAGIETLRVDLHPGSEDTAEMLRDAGFASDWDIDYPLTRVTLRLASSRPGWSTPQAPIRRSRVSRHPLEHLLRCRRR
jgi:GNAT superfamily N-acetyltransferase